MVDQSEKLRKRQAEAARLRIAARATTPQAYQTRKIAQPTALDQDQTIDTKETYTNLFGSFTGGNTWQSHVASAMMLGAQGLAYVLLIIVLNLAQCSLWYEPGMYSDPDRIQSSGR